MKLTDDQWYCLFAIKYRSYFYTGQLGLTPDLNAALTVLQNNELLTENRATKLYTITDLGNAMINKAGQIDLPIVHTRTVYEFSDKTYVNRTSDGTFGPFY